jgi:hypothetical protein
MLVTFFFNMRACVLVDGCHHTEDRRRENMEY